MAGFFIAREIGTPASAHLTEVVLHLLAQQGIDPGAIERNMASYGHEVDFAAGVETWQQRVLADAQTSGGLLVSVAPEAVEVVLKKFVDAGFVNAAVIGVMREGGVRVAVR